MIGEQFNEFFVRVKTLAEAVNVCTGGHADCESTQLKQYRLALIPEQFLNPISQVTHAAVQSGAMES